MARLLEIRTFISYPVFTAEGRFFGTLCGASKEAVDVQQEILDLMRRHASTAERIKEWLRHNRPFALPR